MSENITFLLSEYPDLQTETLKNNGIKKVTVEDANATVNDAMALLTCRFMSKAVDVTLYLSQFTNDNATTEDCHSGLRSICNTQVTFRNSDKNLIFNKRCQTEQRLV